MKMVYMQEEKEEHAFAISAAKNFEEHPKHYTFTEKNIEAGCLFALRFGLGDDCVIVFKLAEDFEPVNYQQLIKKKRS